jgi:hypothetical protein
MRQYLRAFELDNGIVRLSDRDLVCTRDGYGNGSHHMNQPLLTNIPPILLLFVAFTILIAS